MLVLGSCNAILSGLRVCPVGSSNFDYYVVPGTMCYLHAVLVTSNANSSMSSWGGFVNLPFKELFISLLA